VASSSPSEHEHHLDLLFQRLSEYGLVINATKSVFGAETVVFLGQVSADGISALPERVADLQNFPRTATARGLRRFPGMLNFLRRLHPHAAEHQVALNDVLSGLRGARPVPWTPALEQAFDSCTASFCDLTLLAHPKHDVNLGLFLLMQAPRHAAPAFSSASTTPGSL